MASPVRINFVTGAARLHMPEIEAIATMPERLEGVFAGQGTAWTRQAHIEGEWTPARILGHLIAYTQQQRENLYRMSFMTDPVIKMTDDEGEAEINNWDSQAAPALLERLGEAVGEVVHLLKELPDASWGRPGQHPEDGRRSIKQQTQYIAAHFEEHIAQLESYRSATR